MLCRWSVYPPQHYRIFSERQSLMCARGATCRSRGLASELMRRRKCIESTIFECPGARRPRLLVNHHYRKPTELASALDTGTRHLVQLGHFTRRTIGPPCRQRARCGPFASPRYRALHLVQLLGRGGDISRLRRCWQMNQRP